MDEALEILLTTALSFDSISDGTLTDRRISLQTASKTQEKCGCNFIDGQSLRGVEVKGTVAAN